MDIVIDYTKSILGQNNKDSKLVGNEEMIRLSDALQGVSKNIDISIPNIVVIGTQSSGKTSTLNSLIGLDILPTGKHMVTRTPLKLEIIRNYNKSEPSYIEFGEYVNGSWESKLHKEITYPIVTNQEAESILNYINEETIVKAGDQKDVSDQMIFLKIVSPYVCNLSLIDLPGLTNVACTDLGQPENIKDKIEKLIEKFACNKNSILLAILPGRSDLEADYGLEIVKKIDVDNSRTVGVLTKIDLMNDDKDLKKYLDNNISKDLQLKYGYFAIKNKNSKESKNLSVKEGIVKEEKFFSSHTVYSKPQYVDKTGINSLRKYLAELLTVQMKKNLPSIKESITNEISLITQKLDKFGYHIPNSEDSRIAYVQSLTMQLCNEFSYAIKNNNTDSKTGRNLRDIFIKFRKNIGENNIYDKSSIITNDDINSILVNSQGNHMSFPFPPIEIIERCLQDKKHRPIFVFNKLSQDCLNEVAEELVILVKELIQNTPIQRFANFGDIVKNQSINNLIKPLKETCSKQINNLILMQEKYIWTDNQEFRENLLKLKDNNNLIDILRNLLRLYIRSISEHIKDVIPKTIMFYLVYETVDKIYMHLYSHLVKSNLGGLLVENREIEERRSSLLMQKTELINIKNVIENLDQE